MLPKCVHMICVLYVFCIIDIDECLDSLCHEMAKCTNTGGSFECECQTGYNGDGHECLGKRILNSFFVCMISYHSVLYCLLVQILTSVIWRIGCVERMHTATTLQEAMCVSAMLDFRMMDSPTV